MWDAQDALLTTFVKKHAVFCWQVVEEQLEDEDSEDVYIFSKVADIIHSLFLTYKLSFYPYFDQIVGHFVKCLVSWVTSAKIFVIAILSLIVQSLFFSKFICYITVYASFSNVICMSDFLYTDLLVAKKY
jgi:hypothetical protein